MKGKKIVSSFLAVLNLSAPAFIAADATKDGGKNGGVAGPNKTVTEQRKPEIKKNVTSPNKPVVDQKKLRDNKKAVDPKKATIDQKKPEVKKDAVAPNKPIVDQKKPGDNKKAVDPKKTTIDQKKPEVKKDAVAPNKPAIDQKKPGDNKKAVDPKKATIDQKKPEVKKDAAAPSKPAVDQKKPGDNKKAVDPKRQIIEKNKEKRRSSAGPIVGTTFASGSVGGALGFLGGWLLFGRNKPGKPDPSEPIITSPSDAGLFYIKDMDNARVVESGFVGVYFLGALFNYAFMTGEDENNPNNCIGDANNSWQGQFVIDLFNHFKNQDNFNGLVPNDGSIPEDMANILEWDSEGSKYKLKGKKEGRHCTKKVYNYIAGICKRAIEDGWTAKFGKSKSELKNNDIVLFEKKSDD